MCISLQRLLFVLDTVCIVPFERCLADPQSGDNSLLRFPPYHSPHTRTPTRREKIRPFCFLNLRRFGLCSQRNLITDNVMGMWDARCCLASLLMRFPHSSSPRRLGQSGKLCEAGLPLFKETTIGTGQTDKGRPEVAVPICRAPLAVQKGSPGGCTEPAPLSTCLRMFGFAKTQFLHSFQEQGCKVN